MNRIAYYTNESFENADGTFTIALVEENTPGYSESGFSADSVRDAKLIAQLLNDQHGHLYDDVLDIVASSMRMQNSLGRTL
jgi:hypothetical protein